MNNPFGYLQAEREAQERAFQERKKRLLQAAEAAIEQYGGEIIRALKDLQQVAYPNCHVYGGDRINWYEHAHGLDISWRIVRSWPDYDEDKVTVRLVLSEFGEPKCFRVKRSGAHKRTLLGLTEFEELRCGLSERELVDALRRLHPPGSV